VYKHTLVPAAFAVAALLSAPAAWAATDNELAEIREQMRQLRES
jgi:hypothetical protein